MPGLHNAAMHVLVTSPDSQPAPDVIRGKAAEIVARAEYHLDQGLDADSRRLWEVILYWIIRPFVWLFNILGELPTELKIVVMIVLGIVCIALITHIVWSLVSAIRGSPKGPRAAGRRPSRHIDPKELESAAKAAAGEGDFLEAIRLLFKAALVRIERSEKKKLRAGMTNRELLQRYARSSLNEPLAGMVDLVDRKWYGTESCESADYAECLQEHSVICRLTRGGPDAVRA